MIFKKRLLIEALCRPTLTKNTHYKPLFPFQNNPQWIIPAFWISIKVKSVTLNKVSSNYGLGNCTHHLDLPYCQIIKIKNTDSQFRTPWCNWQKSKTNKKKNTGNCKHSAFYANTIIKLCKHFMFYCLCYLLTTIFSNVFIIHFVHITEVEYSHTVT